MRELRGCQGVSRCRALGWCRCRHRRLFLILVGLPSGVTFRFLLVFGLCEVYATRLYRDSFVWCVYAL